MSMACSREGFDLFSKHGRRNFIERIKMHRFNGLSYVWSDTFGQIICGFIGHNVYTVDKNYPKEFACRRCHKFIESSSLGELE